MAPPLYLHTKATKILGKMSDPVRDAIRSDFLETYRNAPPPYFVRCPNIVMHSLDYVDLSAEKRYFKHRQVRPLADIEKKHRLEQRRDPPLLAREGIYGSIVKPFPQKGPIDAVAAGVREFHRYRSALPVAKRKPFSAEQIRPKPATNISRISVAGRTLGRRAWSCGVPPTEQETPSPVRLAPSCKDSKRPSSAAIDSHMRIKVDREYLDALQKDQRLRYEMQRHLNPDYNPLGDPSLARVRFCVCHETRYNQLHCRCRGVNPSFYPQEPSKWLSFTGTKTTTDDDTGANESTVTAFFHDGLAHDYSMEQSTGCTVAHSLLEREHEVLIGINGQVAPSQVPESEVRARESARSAIYYDDPRVPLCWDDQLHKAGVRVVGTHKKDGGTSQMDALGFERRLIPVTRPTPAQRPSICQRPESRVSRENQMLQITRQTRALENSKVTQLPLPPKRPLTAAEKSKQNEPLSYDDVLEILRLQAAQKARAEADAAAAAAAAATATVSKSNQQDNHNLEALEQVLAQRETPHTPARPSPRAPSPLLSPSGGLTKPISANSFRTTQPDLHLELRLRLRARPPPKSGIEVSGKTSPTRGRLITGGRLHKSGVDTAEPPDAEFIHIVSPFHLPANPEALHDVATNMVRERTFESRNEMVGGRQYPCTPVSHNFEEDSVTDEDDHAEASAEPSRTDLDASCATGDTMQSEILESQHTVTASASSFEVTIPRADDSPS